jgi:hypothetical protein
VIVRRFEAATGNQAVLVETGETFEALATQGAGTGVGLRPAPAVADVADEPPRNGRLLPVKRVGACTAEVRGSNPGVISSVAEYHDIPAACGGISRSAKSFRPSPRKASVSPIAASEPSTYNSRRHSLDRR